MCMITVQEASQSFLDYQKNRLQNGEISEATYDSIEYRLGRIIDWAGEDTPIDQVDTSDLENHFNSEYSYSSRTVKDFSRVASKLQNYPTKDQLENMLERARNELETSLNHINTVIKAASSSNS